MPPLRPWLALTLCRAADAAVPRREPATALDRWRYRAALALIDASFRLDGRPALADALADLTSPPTLRSRVNAPGGRS